MFHGGTLNMKSMFIILGTLALARIIGGGFVDQAQKTLTRNKLLATIPKLSKTWDVSFEVFPTQMVPAWTSILHLSTGGDFNVYGDRTPAVFALLNGNTFLYHICSSVSGHRNYCYNHVTNQINQWVKFRLQQRRIGNNYVYTININGQEIHRVINSMPREFQNVKVYAADNWYAAQPGYIRNLVIRDSSAPTPKISLETAGSRMRFKCEFTPTGESGSRYEVVWFYSFEGMEGKISEEVLPKGEHVAYLVNTDSTQRFRIGYTVFARLRTWTTGEDRNSASFAESNKYYLGFKFDQDVLSVSENGIPTNLRISSTVPILCEDGSTNCYVLVRLIQSTSAIIFNQCSVTFKASKTFPVTRTVTVMAKRDYIDNPNGKVAISVTIEYRPTEASSKWDWYKASSPTSTVQVTTTSVSGGQCTSTGDPHILTFDNVWIDHYYEGDYTLVSSSARRFEVQARTKGILNCGVAVREGDDVLVVDACKNTPEPRYASNQEPVRGTYIERSANGRLFVLKFASGAVVKVQAHGSYVDLTVQVPPDDFGKTKGLCGILDNNAANDLTSKGGQVFSNCRGRKCPAFKQSYKLSREESLFYYDAVHPQLKCLPTTKSAQCSCGRDGVNCNLQMTPPLVQQATNGFTRMLFFGQADCDRLHEAAGAGKPTKPTGPVFVLPPCKHCVYPYAPSPRPPVDPKWPTKSGLTESDANKICNDGLKNTELYQVCKKYVDATMVAGFIGQCIADVQILDRKGSEAAIESAIDAFKDTCEEQATKDPNNWKKGENGKLEPLKELEDVLCPNQCSNHGTCNKGKCVCNEGYLTEDCSVKKGQKPKLTLIKDGTMCISDNKNDCSKIRVVSEGLVPGDVICHIEIAGQPVVKSKATLISYCEVICQLPTGSCGKAGYADMTYKIKLANGDAISENELAYRTVNEKCVSCKDDNCVAKADACVVNLCCYGSSEADPNDSKCSFCKPTIDTTGFTIDSSIKGCGVYGGKTSGGNADGAKCVFPFTYDGQTYKRCIGLNNDKLWCATTNSYDADRKWGNCVDVNKVKTSGGSGNGADCVFPFIYKGQTYNGCIETNNNQPWCSTTSNYDNDWKWGNCVGGVSESGTSETVYKGNTSGGNAKGAKCSFPFIYDGKTYKKCIEFNNDQPWCSTTRNYDDDGIWGNCG